MRGATPCGCSERRIAFTGGFISSGATPELLFQARQAQSLTYNPTPIVLAAAIYFLMLWPLVRVLSRLENRALAGRG